MDFNNMVNYLKMYKLSTIYNNIDFYKLDKQ